MLRGDVVLLETRYHKRLQPSLKKWREAHNIPDPYEST